MRKISPALLSVLLLCSCGKQQASGTPSSAGMPPEETPASAPAETAPPLDEIIAGDWKIIPKEESYSNEVSAVTLSFSPGEMKTMDAISGIGSASAVTFGDIYETGSGQITKMTVVPEELTGDLEYQDQVLGIPVDYQILYTVLGNDEILALRENGNGMSYFGYSVLNTEYLDPHYFWIFRREAEEPAAEKADRHCDDTFYAFCWLAETDSVLLQEVGTSVSEENWNDEYIDVLSLIPDYQGHREAVLYPVAEEIQWRIRPDTSLKKGSISPSLIRVTTDAEGTVIKLDHMDYLGYGMYEATESSMFRYKDLLPYDSADTVFAYHPGDILTYEGDMVYADISRDSDPAEVFFFTRRNLRDFRILDLTFKESDASGTPVFDITEVYHLDRFSPAHPLSVKMNFYGSLPNNAISYTDTDGTVKYYYISISGMDGSYVLSEMTEN